MSAADDGTRPIVAGFERPVGDPGLVLVGELGCVACHKADPAALAHLTPKRAPILDGVGGRVRPSYLQAYLTDPRGTKPGTTMPDLLHDLPPPEKARVVEALTHFLASTGPLAHARPGSRAVATGEALYHKVGCVACHGPLDRPASGPVPTPVPLGDLVAKATVPGLASFLRDPLAVRPSGRMPGLGLTPQEASEVAQYLLRSAPAGPPPDLAYRAFEGDWEKIPDLAALTPTASGRAGGFDVGLATRDHDAALRFEGWLAIEAAGRYTFFLRSDDGSRLAIDGKAVVDHDGIHSASNRRGFVTLDRGPHRVVVDWINGGGESELSVEVAGPGLARQDLAGLLATEPGAADPDRIAIDPALVAEGKALFARVGCASCHELRTGGSPIIADASAIGPPLARLAGLNGGCLAESPRGPSPRFGLDDAQRAAIGSALAGIAARADRPPTRDETIARTMAALDCHACHRRGEAGGVSPGLDARFETTQKEMGDEGRIPPRLDGVGAKLNDAYLDRVLDQGAKDRPYMLTRMPRFGADNAGPLARAFREADAVGPVAAVHFDETTKRVKSTGRFLVGAEALSCVKCHTFRGSEAEGIQAIDLTAMPRRLRRDWFHRYVVDPPAFRPGTRMPTSWPGGKSILPDVLDGETRKQVEAIWNYLADGASASPPAGLGRQPMPLFALDDPLIYRNFIAGAGPKAIGVGYPERVDLAFDADRLRLALVWRGGFIDASRHWSGRGEGYQPPMGDDLIALPDGPSFARLDPPTSPWPASAPADRPGDDRFRGYRLDRARRPTFLYSLGPVRVEETPEPVAAVGKGSPTLRRVIRLTAPGPVAGLWFRAAVAGTIEPKGDGWFLVDGEWRVRLGPGPGAIVRPSGAKRELIAPVLFDGPTATLIEEFSW